MAPQFPILTETAHPAEFVLSEAAGQRSRDNAQFVDPIVVRVGQPCKQSVAATTDTLATYVIATTGANAEALTLYGGASSSGNNVKIAVLTRDCEVNGRLVDWGAMSPAEQTIAAATLATKGIILRF